jgi:chromosomal replication initiator protein
LSFKTAPWVLCVLRLLSADRYNGKLLDMMSLDWNATINTIRESLPATQFHNWFKPVEFVRADESSVVLSVPSRFHEEWLRNHYQDQITDAIRQQCGTEVQLEFQVLVREENWEASHSPAALKQENAPRTAPALATSTAASLPQPTWIGPVEGVSDLLPFEESAAVENLALAAAPVLPPFHHDYFELSYNHVAYQCAQMFIDGKDLQLNPLILHAGVGMGKSHLLSLVGERIYRKNPTLRVRYTSTESFFHEYVRHLKTNELFQFKKLYTDQTDVLLFDDAQALSGKLKIQEALLHIFNEIIARGGRLAFTTTVAPQKLENFIEPLRSRLLSGLTAEVKPLGHEEKTQLLERLAHHNQIAIEPEALRSLADRGQKDVRELIGSLLRAHLQSKLENAPLNCEFLAHQPCTVQPKQNNVTLQEIIGLVEHNMGVSRVDLASKSRKGNITWARQVAMYLARSFTLLSLEEIGRNFGRDHATVIHAFQKVSDTIAEHPTRKYEVEFLKKKLEK